jgi:hypothetical protein
MTPTRRVPRTSSPCADARSPARRKRGTPVLNLIPSDHRQRASELTEQGSSSQGFGYTARALVERRGHIQIPLPACRRVADVKQRMAWGIILRLLNIDRGANRQRASELTEQGSSSQGFGYTARALVERRVTSNWFVGAAVDAYSATSRRKAPAAGAAYPDPPASLPPSSGRKAAPPRRASRILVRRCPPSAAGEVSPASASPRGNIPSLGWGGISRSPCQPAAE